MAKVQVGPKLPFEKEKGTYRLYLNYNIDSKILLIDYLVEELSKEYSKMERITPTNCPLVPRKYCDRIFESIAGKGNCKIKGC